MNQCFNKFNVLRESDSETSMITFNGESQLICDEQSRTIDVSICSERLGLCENVASEDESAVLEEWQALSRKNKEDFLNFTADTETELPVFEFSMGVSDEIVSGLYNLSENFMLNRSILFDFREQISVCQRPYFLGFFFRKFHKRDQFCQTPMIVEMRSFGDREMGFLLDLIGSEQCYSIDFYPAFQVDNSFTSFNFKKSLRNSEVFLNIYFYKKTWQWGAVECMSDCANSLLIIEEFCRDLGIVKQL